MGSLDPVSLQCWGFGTPARLQTSEKNFVLR